MQSKKAVIASVAILASAIFATSLVVTTASAQTDMGSDMITTVVRDSETVLLAFKTLQPDDYIHLYDSTPYMIMNGHVAAKLPCDRSSETPMHIMIGVAPDLRPAELELISELSKPGTYCLYHVDLESIHDGTEDIVTDIAIHNPTDKPIRMPQTGSVVIGVNEIMPLGESEHEE